MTSINMAGVSLSLLAVDDVIGSYLGKCRRPRGPTDKAPDYESGDSRFESWRGRIFYYLCDWAIGRENVPVA